MVDITFKPHTFRQATATAVITTSSVDTIELVKRNAVPKGNIFDFSRAAGLLAIKNTSAVIPDCHPLPVEYASVRHELDGLTIIITVEVHTIYKTGIEDDLAGAAFRFSLGRFTRREEIDYVVQTCIPIIKGYK